MRFACQYCEAPDAIALPPGGSKVVVCTACRKPQPRRIYEGQAATGPTAAPARRLGALPFIVFVVLGGLGFGALALLGATTPGGFAVSALLILAGAATSALGVWVVKNPTAFGVSRNMGEDAFGMQQWGPSQPATRGQGLVNGFAAVGVGVLVVALGVVLGVVTPH